MEKPPPSKSSLFPVITNTQLPVRSEGVGADKFDQQGVGPALGAPRSSLQGQSSRNRTGQGHKKFLTFGRERS